MVLSSQDLDEDDVMILDTYDEVSSSKINSLF